MTIQEPIKLRGHHIANLAHLFIDMVNGKSDTYIRNEYGKLKEPNYTGESDSERDRKLAEAIKDEVLEKLEVELYDLFLSNPNTQVEVVEVLDSLCGRCPIPKRDSCLYGREDEFCLEAYGLIAGKTYSASDLVRTMITFNYQNPQFKTPRALYARNPLYFYIKHETERQADKH